MAAQNDDADKLARYAEKVASIVARSRSGRLTEAGSGRHLDPESLGNYRRRSPRYI